RRSAWRPRAAPPLRAASTGAPPCLRNPSRDRTMRTRVCAAELPTGLVALRRAGLSHGGGLRAPGGRTARPRPRRPGHPPGLLRALPAAAAGRLLAGGAVRPPRAAAAVAHRHRGGGVRRARRDRDDPD